MKRTEIEVGMIVAVKRGPASKDRYKAVILDTRDWCETDGGEQGEYVVKTAATMVKAYGFGPRTGIAIAKKRPYPPKGELPKWEPEIAPLSLIAETWATYEARRAVAHSERSAAVRAKDAAYEALVDRRSALEARLGVKAPHPTEFETMTLRLSDLEAIADKLSTLTEALVEYEYSGGGDETCTQACGGTVNKPHAPTCLFAKLANEVAKSEEDRRFGQPHHGHHDEDHQS